MTTLTKYETGNGDRLTGTIPLVAPDPQPDSSGWTFLSNHAHVLLCIGRDPEIRIRDIAQLVGITERAAQSIVTDLVEEGFVVRERVGRRNRYHLNPDLALRHPLEADHRIGELLDLLAGTDTAGTASTKA